MCFHSKQSKSAQELKQRFKAEFPGEECYKPSDYVGFQYPETPVITHAAPHTIELLQWGLIPAWAKDTDIRKHTLNARMETIHEKPSFRQVAHHRCLVLVDGYYEWQWLDEKGKKKQKYLIALPGGEAFALAGIWSEWVDTQTGELLKTYSILTTEANALLSRIHNSKKRMPVMLKPDHEQDWLAGNALETGDAALIAEPVGV